MGRAMVREPSVFLFDEPLSNLDAKLRGQMRIEIGALQRRLKTTTVYVTHDQVEAMTLGDRIVVLAKGRIQQVGTPIDLYRAPANRFVAGFIGTPPMNFIDGSLSREKDAWVFATDGVRVAIDTERRRLREPTAGKATLGIRAESLTLANGDASDKPRLEGRVAHVERLGMTTQLHVKIGAHMLVAAVDSRSEARIDDAVALALEPTEIHVFGEDGLSLVAK